MANNISGTVWRIDTIPFSYAQPVKVDNVNWTEAANVGDRFVMQTNTGNPIMDARANQVNYTQNFGKLGPWQNSGIKITTLDSGVVYITVGGGK